jgi:RNase H-fold protein (predicted Holliday junction resolvase)
VSQSESRQFEAKTIGFPVSPDAKSKRRSAATRHMAELEQSPDPAKVLFQDKDTRYAA